MPLSNMAGAIVLIAVFGGTLLLARFFVHLIEQFAEENEVSDPSPLEKEARDQFYGLAYPEDPTEITNTKIFENLSRPLYHYLHYNNAEALINLPNRLSKSSDISLDGHTLSIIEVGVPASNEVIQNESCPICRSTFEKKPFQLTKIQIKEWNSVTHSQKYISYKHNEEITPPCIDCQTNIIQQSTDMEIIQNNPEVLAAAHL